MKRRPSECGEFETGCHGPDANNMALIALTHRGPSEALEKLRPEWEEAMQDMQRKTLATTAEELERMSLGWLLANATEEYESVAITAANAEDDFDVAFDRLATEDTETIRDWFCWLHREMVDRAREHKLQLEIQESLP